MVFHGGVFVKLSPRGLLRVVQGGVPEEASYGTLGVFSVDFRSKLVSYRFAKNICDWKGNDNHIKYDLYRP